MNKNYLVFVVFILFILLAQVAYADYPSLQNNDCTLINEFAGDDGKEYLINSNSVCSPYNAVGTTTPIKVQIFSKCVNGDVYNPRFDVFTYNGVRGTEIGGSDLYQEGENFPLFVCDNLDRNLDGLIKIPMGTNRSFFVVISNATSSASVVDLFEKGTGNLNYALAHFDVKSRQPHSTLHNKVIP